MTITDWQCARLKWNIARIMQQLSDFQKVYNHLTGKDFIPEKSVEAYFKDMERLEDK